MVLIKEKVHIIKMSKIRTSITRSLEGPRHAAGDTERNRK